jgi:hypothetical protein
VRGVYLKNGFHKNFQRKNPAEAGLQRIFIFIRTNNFAQGLKIPSPENIRGCSPVYRGVLRFRINPLAKTHAMLRPRPARDRTILWLLYL